ncbi:MAG: hypothetical protein RLZZ292_1268 [Bacteroidota bacterium]|jgi:hypothetical protein
MNNIQFNELSLLLEELNSIPSEADRSKFDQKWQLFLTTLSEEDKKEALIAFLNTVTKNSNFIENYFATKQLVKAA